MSEQELTKCSALCARAGRERLRNFWQTTLTDTASSASFSFGLFQETVFFGTNGFLFEHKK